MHQDPEGCSGTGGLDRGVAGPAGVGPQLLLRDLLRPLPSTDPGHLPRWASPPSLRPIQLLGPRSLCWGPSPHLISPSSRPSAAGGGCRVQAESRMPPPWPAPCCRPAILV